ncbi:MAG: redox-sensing transcriptional repressor Rex [Lachnospiraceae bacterium]
MEKQISQAVITRLPRYFRYLGDLKDQGIERVSSKELSELMQVTASQIRQDLNNFGGFGQQGYGYNVAYLYEEMSQILGLHREHNLVIIGVGNLGQAIVNYGNFSSRGFHFRGVFDSNEALRGKLIKDMPIRGMDELEGFIKEYQIDIAVLTIPKHVAKKVADRLVQYGIKGIWNFAHIDLRLPPEIQVENVHLSDSLMKLSYNLHEFNSQI